MLRLYRSIVDWRGWLLRVLFKRALIVEMGNGEWRVDDVGVRFLVEGLFNVIAPCFRGSFFVVDCFFFSFSFFLVGCWLILAFGFFLV